MTDKQSAIVIRFAVQDGQKVSEALKRLEQDGTATFGKLDRASRDPVRGFVLLNGAADELRSRMAGVAAQGGLVGSVLASGGVRALAFAAALGVVVAGMRGLITSAPQLIANADAAGLSLAKYQSLRAGIVDAGGTGEQASQGLRQFAVQLRAAQMSSGDLYEEVRRLNPELARQLALSKDQDEALRIVVKAMDAATLASQRAKIGNAAFGESWRFVAAGIRRDQQGLVSAERIISPELVQRAAEVSAKINAIVEAISTRFMVAMGPAVQLLNDFLKRLGEADQRGWQESERSVVLGSRARIWAAQATGRRNSPDDQSFADMDGVMRRQKAAQDELDKLNRDFVRINADYENAMERRGIVARSGENTNVANAVADAALNRRNEAADQIKRLQEQLRQLAAEEEKIRQEYQARGTRHQAPAPAAPPAAPPEVTIRPSPAALAAADRQREIQALTNEQAELLKKTGAMGEAASATDRLRLAEIALRLAQLDRAGVTQRDIDLTRSINQTRIEAERVAARTALGIASEEERMALRRREVNNQVRAGILTQDEATRSLALYRKELRETVNQEQVRASFTPGLTKIRQDASRDIRLDADDLATQGINEYSRGILGLTQSYKDAKTAALEWGASILTMMAQIALKRAVLGPLANAFSGAIESFTGSFTSSALGNVMTAAGPMSLTRYALGGVHSSPGGIARGRTFSEFGEGRTPEAYVPLPDGRTIPATVDFRNVPINPTAALPRSTAAAAQMTQTVNILPPAGHEAETRREPNGQGGENVMVVFRRMMEQGFMQDVKDGGPMSTMLALLGKKPAGSFR